MGIWDWHEECVRAAVQSGDLRRLEMLGCVEEGFEHRESDPEQALACFARGRQLARELDEPWWGLFYEIWSVHARATFLRDYRDLLDDAVRCVMQVQKPEFRGHPWRFAAFLFLIDAYLNIDPLGHEAAIRAALEQMDAEIPPGPADDRFVLLEYRVDFLEKLGDLAGAVRESERHLGLVQSDPDYDAWYELTAQATLCWLHFGLRDWAALAERVGLVEELARRQPLRQFDVAKALVWQAVLARRAGDVDRARRCYRQAAYRAGRVKRIPPAAYYDALVYYHGMSGQWHHALKAREAELARVGGRGMLAYECDLRIDRCRLVAELGRLTEQDLEAARAAAAGLRRPGPYLDRIAALGKGG